MNETQTQGVVADMPQSLKGEAADPENSLILQEDQLTSSDVVELNGEFNYDGYQVVRREFFAHINEPSVTFNNYKFYVNAACLRRFPSVDYVQVLVNQESTILAIRPCHENERDAFSWCTTGSGKRNVRQITCRLFFAKVFDLMRWNPDYRYKLLGKVIHANGEYLIAFDLTATEVYQRVMKDGQKSKTSRTPVFPEGWQNQFGLPFKEHQKSMQVDIFEGYAVYGIKENTVSPIDEATGEHTDSESVSEQNNMIGGALA